MNERILYQEHLLLGASFDERVLEGLELPSHYASGEGEGDGFSSGAALSDLSGMGSLLVSGPPAAGFVEMAFSGRRLSVGECAFEAVLGGDGTLMGVPLLARTGDAEYVLWDPSARYELLSGWLGFLQGVSQDGYAPYRDVVLEDVSGRLVPLSLWGPGAHEVLLDYVRGSRDLPGEGQVRDCRLDAIPAVVACPRTPDGGANLLLVPPDYASVIWRSLLSFQQVSPAGERALVSHLEDVCPWMPWLEDVDKVTPTREELERLGLTRHDSGFVGARAI